MTEKIKEPTVGHTFGPVAREASELADESGGGNTGHRAWSWTIPGGSINISVDYDKGVLDMPELSDFTPLTTLEYMVEDFIDNSLDLIEDAVTDIKRYRRDHDIKMG